MPLDEGLIAGIGALVWPVTPPAHGPVVLRAFSDADMHLALELSTDPYVPLTGTLPARATEQQASEWIDRHRGRPAKGAGSPSPSSTPKASVPWVISGCGWRGCSRAVHARGTASHPGNVVEVSLSQG
jgi:hypothetical protein